MRSDSAWVYIMTNRSRTLYVGVTSNLERRVQEHKSGMAPGSFTQRYRLDRLVYYERFTLITSAIDREKQIKGWLRIKKIGLIVSQNPDWKDRLEGLECGVGKELSARRHRLTRARRWSF